MRWDEWLLSVLFVGFIALKLVEGFFVVESWPLSHVPMFAARHPPESRPVRVAFYGKRAGSWFVMEPFLFGLNRAELNRRLLHSEDQAAACSALVRAFNRSRPPARRVTAAYVSFVTFARPGTGAADFEQRIDCPVEGVTR